MNIRQNSTVGNFAQWIPQKYAVDLSDVLLPAISTPKSNQPPFCCPKSECIIPRVHHSIIGAALVEKALLCGYRAMVTLR
jgi:hypothetical protein